MFALVVLIPKPAGNGQIQLCKRAAPESGEKLPPDGSEEALDFAFALRFVRPGMDKRDTQTGTDVLQLPGPVCRSVVDIQPSGQAPTKQRLPEGVQKAGKRFGRVELCVGYQTRGKKGT
jgi:hypothetical protein